MLNTRSQRRCVQIAGYEIGKTDWRLEFVEYENEHEIYVRW